MFAVQTNGQLDSTRYQREIDARRDAENNGGVAVNVDVFRKAILTRRVTVAPYEYLEAYTEVLARPRPKCGSVTEIHTLDGEIKFAAAGATVRYTEH